MSLVIRLVAAMIHGMSGHELRQWVSCLSGRAGDELRRITEDALTDDEVLSADGADRIATWLRENHDEAAGLLPALLARTARQDAADDTVISDYLAVLNGVVAAARCCGRPLVLRGFFHTPDCLTYWHFHCEEKEPLRAFEKDPCEELITCAGHWPRIFILEGPATNERVWALNLEIRKSPSHRLERSVYAGTPEVHIVREFEVEFTLGDPDVEIPPGAPGIVAMMASLPLALDAQRMPEVQLDETMSRYQDGGR